MRVRTPRTEYRLARLSERNAPGEPFPLFGRWFRAVLALGGADPQAVALATADRRGRPSCRMMLLKSWGPRGFVLASNYSSRKGRELAANPAGALLFYWPALQKQVRVEGRLARLPARESDALWQERPRGAQLGALASDQSRAIRGRGVLERRFALAAEDCAGEPVPRPAHWGGWRLRPSRIEFWQGRADRLHDRILYRRRGSRWTRERLAP